MTKTIWITKMQTQNPANTEKSINAANLASLGSDSSKRNLGSISVSGLPPEIIQNAAGNATVSTNEEALRERNLKAIPVPTMTNEEVDLEMTQFHPTELTEEQITHNLKQITSKGKTIEDFPRNIYRMGGADNIAVALMNSMYKKNPDASIERIQSSIDKKLTTLGYDVTKMKKGISAWNRFTTSNAENVADIMWAMDIAVSVIPGLDVNPWYNEQSEMLEAERKGYTRLYEAYNQSRPMRASHVRRDHRTTDMDIASKLNLFDILPLPTGGAIYKGGKAIKNIKAPDAMLTHGEYQQLATLKDTADDLGIQLYGMDGMPANLTKPTTEQIEAYSKTHNVSTESATADLTNTLSQEQYDILAKKLGTNYTKDMIDKILLKGMRSNENTAKTMHLLDENNPIVKRMMLARQNGNSPYSAIKSNKDYLEVYKMLEARGYDSFDLEMKTNIYGRLSKSSNLKGMQKALEGMEPKLLENLQLDGLNELIHVVSNRSTSVQENTRKFTNMLMKDYLTVEGGAKIAAGALAGATTGSYAVGFAVAGKSALKAVMKNLANMARKNPTKFDDLMNTRIVLNKPNPKATYARPVVVNDGIL